MKRTIIILVFLSLVMPSLPIEPIKLVGGGSVWTQTTQSDFEAGTLINLDSKTTPGDLSLQKRTDWWNTNWKYRIPITVKESYNYARTNEDATIKVKIDKTKISSANELRLIDSNNNEVPYIKRFETVGANDITYELTFPITMSALATNNYYLYYGNPGAPAIYSIDKYPNYPGWSNPTTTRCGSIGMMGGYNVFGIGASTQKTINLEAGRYTVSFKYYHIDSWDGESGRLFWNGVQVWSRAHTYGGTHICGGGFGELPGVGYGTTTITVNHPGGNAVIKFDSTLNQGASDESWGVDEINIIKNPVSISKNLPLNNFNKWNSPWGSHAYSEAVDIDDVDNDGTIELATTALEYTGSYWRLVLRVFNWKNKVLAQEGWTSASVWGNHEYGMGLVIADVDNDGDKEIVTCGMAYYATDGYWRSVLRIWNWNGASFTHETYTYWLSPWSRHSHAYKVYADDVDKDGVKEILIAGLEYSGSNWYSGLRIFSWIGGSLSSETWYYWLPEGPHDHAYNVYSDDVDNDGTKEIVVVGLTSVGGLWVTAYLRIFTWVGGALTTEAYERLRSDWNNQMYYHGVYICDVDRDGVKEILVGSMQYSGSNWYNDLRIYSWISNTLTLEKSERWLAPGGSHGHVYSVYAADIDNDGIVEILTGGLHSDSAHSWVSGFLAIWTWNGNVLLKEREIIWKDSGTNTYDSHWGQALKAKDIDKDGRMEIVTYGFVTTSPYTAFLRIYTDIGGLSFTYGDIEGYYYFSGSYVSVVYDTLPTNTSLDYLKIFWTATVPAGTSLVFSTRTGDTNIPDDTWSVWSSNYTSSGSMITSPNRRYIQYRAIFICDGTKTPVLSDVSIQYNKFPSAPSLSKPTGDAIFNISTPSFILVSNDEDGDKLKYKLELSNDNFNSIYATYDLTLSTAGWSSADYAPGANAQYTVQSSLPDGEYQWRGYSNDALVWSKVSEIRKFKIDTIAPISNIEQLPKYSLFLFTVSWSGEDAVSGINYYDIYVSDNGASFKLWKSKTKETSAIFTGQEGHKYEFYSIATDKAGNREVKSIGETETIVDSVSPISSVHQLPNYENKTTFKISWSGKDSGSGIKNYAIYYSENESDFKVWLSETTNNSADFTGLNGVKYSFYSIATDFAGFAEIKDKADTTTIIDALPPISKISQLPEYQTSTSFSVYWSGEDDTSGISKYTIYVSIDNGSYEIWLKDVETTYGTYNGKDGHSYSFYSIATDKAGNIEEKMPVKEAYTKIDTNPPWAYVLPLKQYQNSLSFKVSWTSGGIDVKSYDIFVSDNDAQFETWLEGIDYTSAIFTGLDGHKYKFFATCKDKAGNEVQRPFTFDTFTTIDISPPEITSFLINDGADSTSILGVSLKISAYDKVSGIKDISYSNDNKTFTFWEFYAESKEWDLTTFGGNKTNGEKFVYVRVRDIADNIGYGSASILLIMPDILAKDLSFSANPTIVNTAITIQATIFNNGSAHAKNLVAGFYAGNEFLGESQVGVYTIAELAPQSSYTLTLLWTPQYVGEIKVWVVADLDDKFAEADEGNNKISNSLFVDIGVLPEVYYITINDGALSTHLETVKLKVIAENATLMAFSNDNITWSSWLGYKEECMWKLSPGDGEKTVYFKAKSSKGESRVIKASIILDTKPPKSISLIINDGALYTNKEIVKLGIKAENATLMAFSNDNITWSLWIEYFEEYTWTLTQGDGKKTVYFKTRSGKGESETIKASIVLDTQPPNSVVLSLPNYIKTTEFYVSWSGNDALSSIANYTVQYSNDRLNWFDWLLNVNFTSARWYNTSMNETVYFRCRAIDIVGNIEEYPIGEDTYTTLVKEIPEKKLEKPLALSAPLLALLIGIPLIVALIAVVGIAATRRMMRKGIERISTVMPHILPLKRPEIKLVEAYTFDSFVVAESNKFPYEAAMEVAKNPGKAYNPLFIYGPIGCGKTHLVNSIGNYIKKEKPEFRIQYLTVDEFAARLSEPVDTDVNMLLMDDVQFLARREDVQEKFFYAFNTLYQNGAQIVLTSDRPPKDIEHLQERLRSRFEGGIMAQIKTPELEVRVKVLRREAKKKNTELPDEVVHYIALPVTSIRDLIGSFNKVALYASTNNRPITYELAREALGEYAKFVKEEVPVETVKELPSIDVLLSKVKPKIVEEVVEVERPPSEIPHPPEPELKEERVEVKDEGVYEKIISDKLSSCKSILNELKKKGVEVTDAERMLKLGVSFIRVKKYEKAMGYMEKAEEIAKAKLKLQEDNITAFKDLEEVYECGGCDGLITPGTVGLKCMCGRRYHENCAGRLKVCVECGRRWNV